jgi:PAS domain S-box-containing protein
MIDSTARLKEVLKPTPLSWYTVLSLLTVVFIATITAYAVEGRWDYLISLESALVCALALTRPSRMWLIALPAAIFVADIAAVLIFPTTHPLTAMTHSVYENLQVLLTVFLVERSLGRRFEIRKARDFLLFLGSALVAGLPSIILALGDYLLTGGAVEQITRAAMFSLHITFGITTITPLLLLALRRAQTPSLTTRRIEGIILGAFIILASLIVFYIPPQELGAPPFRYLLFPPLIWAAVRFGALGASLAGIGIMATIAIQLIRRTGPFAGLEGPQLAEAVALVQAYLATLQISSVALGIALEELGRTRSALSESELRFKYATLGSNDGLWNWDQDSQTLELNPRAGEILGYPAESTTWSREFTIAQFHPEDSARLLKAKQQSIKEHRTLDEVIRVRAREGAFRWVHIRGAAFTDTTQDRAWLAGSFADVTEETTRLRILERIATGISLNIVLHEISAYCESQLMGAQVAILHSPPGTPFAQVRAASHLDSEIRAVIEMSTPSPRSCCFAATLYANRRMIIEDLGQISRTEEGTLLFTRTGVRAVWSEPVHDGPSTGTFALTVFFLRPHTASQTEIKLLQECASLAGIALSRARTAEELRERESAYERTLANVSGIAYRVPPHPNACFSYARGGCYELTGYHSSELTSRADLPFSTLIAQEDKHLADSKFEHFKILHDPYEVDYRIVTRSGSMKWVRDQSQGIYDSNANLVAIEGLLTDITPRKGAEERQRTLEDELRQSTKMEAIGTLAGGIAHDFNNILASIIGFTELAKRKIPAANPASEHLNHVLAASLRARNLVGQILTFSRKDSSENRPLSLAATIDEALSFLRATLPSSITLKVSVDKAAPLIKANQTQIHQVLLNLAGNAADSIGDNPGTIEITLSQTSVGTHQNEALPELIPGRYLLLTFRDSGPGISEAVLPRIFDPFFTTKDVGKGTGLGLSVVHGIMRTHGGAIRAESLPGQGATFCLYFPVSGGKFVEESREAAHPLLGRGERILFVDDEEGLVTLATQILTDLNYKVSGYSSSQAAWELFDRNPSGFDLVITDKTMPELSGVELLHRIKSRRPDMPVIMITGLLGEEVEHLSHARERIAVLLKPYTTEVLAGWIRCMLEGKERPTAIGAEAQVH